MPDSDRIDLDLVRRFALALPEATEEPHFDMTSFRVRGRIFATATPDEVQLHVFVDEPKVSASVAENPAAAGSGQSNHMVHPADQCSAPSAGPPAGGPASSRSRMARIRSARSS